MTLRLSKVVLLAGAASYATLVALNNTTDYGTNFAFVQHVLAMDSTFSNNSLAWRAIHHPVLHHAAYVIIILVEWLVAVLGWVACTKMSRSCRDKQQFERGKAWATAALTLGITLWFTGFIVIGGEWFLMWQSTQWNGTQSAFRISVLLVLLLIFINMED